MTKYTEREVRAAIAGFAGYSATHHGIGSNLIAMAEQLADMLAAAEKAEPTDDELVAFAALDEFLLFCSADEFVQIARGVLDRFGINRPAAQPRVPDGYVMVPLNDANWPPIQVVRAMLDCQDADPADGTESEGYYGLRAAIKEWADMLAEQESGR